MKKVISLFTAIVMLFASVVTTIPAAASSDLSSQEYELQVKAENSLGSLLADALLDESESDENKDGFTGYCIGGAEVSGNTVTIDYCAIEDCTIIAALYDDSGENMLMSGNAEVSASERQTTVTISGTMPDYFLLKVYPVDETTLRPLGPEYVNSDHTKAFQEAWAKTTNDFPEELVLNIDDNSDTNFFVHNEEVERVDYVEGVNIVASADFDNNVYVIENADSTFTSLKPGDKLSYIYGDNQIILTLVDSIDINGTTVTVRGAEAHLDDFFDHFQINCESECADVEVVEGTEGDGVTYLGRYGDLQNSTYTLSEDNEVTVSSMMLAGGYSSDPEEYFKTPIAPGSLTFEAEIDKGSFEFTLDLGGDFRIMYDYQIENGKKVDEIWDVRLEVTYDMAVKIGVECKVDEEIKLAEFVLFSFYGINLEVIPKIPYEISGAASVEFRFVGGRVGFQDMYLGEMGGGNHVQCPLNMDPDFAIDVDLEVTIKIGMEFDMAVCFICSDIAKLALSIGAEFVIEASYSGTVFSLAPDELNPPVKHDCGNDCISISAKWGPTVKFTATLFDLNDLSLEYELPIMGEDYYIPVADAYISLKYADAGFGECPHKSYRVDLFLNNSDPENSVVNGASITCEGETKNISSGNHAVFYLHSGMHRFDISVPELESTEEYYVYVDDSPTRCEAFIQYPAKTYTLEFTYPDGSAAAGESVYISNSYAGITDNNGRLDTELCVGKTYSFVTLMSGKGYSDPGKIRIPDINFTGNLQITVYRDGSERPADVQEIEKPWSVIVMVDDVYGEPVSGAGLTIDGLGSFTTNKLGVAHIDVPDNNTYYGTAAKTGHLNTRFAIEAGIETVYVRLVKKANDPSDFEYTISNDEVTVTGYKGGSPCAVIPSEIEGCPVTALGSFTCSTVLEELVMPNSVTTIATSGFTSCKDLKKVLFSDSITSIPSYAFSNLTELTDISLPDNLLAIGEYAFSGCTGLKTVDLPEGLTTLSKKSFGSCTGIKSVYIPSTITDVNEYGSGTVPYGPFTDCVSLKSVEFGAGITTIPEYLFYNCIGLEEIDIPDTVTEIKGDAFRGTSIEELYLPEGLETLNLNSFGSCSNLRLVHIPSTLKEVKNISYGSAMVYYGPFSNCGALKEVTFGNGITTIPRFLFYNTGIEKITIPNTVTTIEVKAFCSCDLLYDVTLSNRLEEIGESAFNDCDILGSIDLPAGLTSIGKGAFYNCKMLGSIELPADLVTLGENAFGNCTSLVSVNIPASLTTTYTGNGPFWNCSALKNVTFDQGISEIPDNLFNQTGLESIVIPNTVTKIGNYSFYKNTKLVSVTIPASVNEIGRYAFSSTGITELYLPEGLQSLGGSAFEYCASLETVHIPSTLTTINIPSGSYAPFRSCSALKEATFGSGISEIPDNLFYNTGLESVVIPNSVKKIGANAFYYCEALGSVDLPTGLTSIGNSAFCNCSALESVELPKGLVTLGENAFGYCKSLVSVNIPASLTTTYTGNGPFWNCSALKNVTFDQGISEIPDRLFYQTGLESVVIPNTVTKIGNYSFYKNTKLVSVTIPASVNEIGKYAFYYTGIKELYLPEGVQSLGGSAFDSCTSLETVHIPSTLTTINIPSGSYAPFWRCSALKNVTFGSGISEIPDKLFYNTGLESVVIPDSVTTIGDYSFSTSTLTAVYIPASVESISTSAFSSCTGLTIYGEMNSYAETFASEKNITFVVGSIPETAAVNSAVVTYEMQSGEELRYTANFTDLDANRIYNFYVMKDRYAQQPFAADNLLYISQHTSDENGVISVTYYPTEVCEDCDIFVVRMRLYDISSANISVADLTYTGERQFADPVVTFDGVELEEGIDYNLKGDFSATEIGTYNMEIVGTGDYYHSTFTSYSILEPEISSIEVTTLPETTEYMLNEELDITGAELTVNYVNNTAKKLSITADMVTGFDSTSVGDKTLTVTYGGQTATFVITVKAVGEFDHALDYTDNIGLVFYMKLGEDILSDDSAEMVFSLNGKTVKVPVAEAAPATVNDDTVYAFTCPVSAAEMADDIQAQIVTNDYESDTFTYSILQYVSDRYTDFRDGEHESGELAEYNAIAAMLNYGAATQEYFGHNTETLANSCLDPSDRNVSSINAGTLSSNRYLITDIKHTKIFRGLVIALKDQVSIKLYFSKNDLSLDDFTVTTGGESIDPSRLSVTCDESDTILEISDIGAGDLGESFTVTIGDVTISNISVLSYAQQVLSTDIEELSDIATALVNYNNCVITAKQCENAA